MLLLMMIDTNEVVKYDNKSNKLIFLISTITTSFD